MCESTGCCGSFIRIVLTIINSLFLLIGLAIFIISAILRWSPDSFLKKIIDNNEVDSLINLSSLNSITIALMVFGGFIVLLSLIGLMGAICANRFFLVIYEIVIVCLFITHVIILIVAAFESSAIEKEFKKSMNGTIEVLNTPTSDPDTVTASCAALKFLSELFECCGAEGPQDFTYNTTFRYECCFKNYTNGCTDKTISSVKSNGVNIIIIPNSIILGFELILVVLVPCLIGRIGRVKRRQQEEERVINIRPTNYYDRNLYKN